MIEINWPEFLKPTDKGQQLKRKKQKYKKHINYKKYIKNYIKPCIMSLNQKIKNLLLPIKSSEDISKSSVTKLFGNAVFC